ncbi:MAG: hypothetical protein MR691_07445 [Clostridium sp.]|nr:hypothetical protein [Clostridium sp.]
MNVEEILNIDKLGKKLSTDYIYDIYDEINTNHIEDAKNMRLEFYENRDDYEDFEDFVFNNKDYYENFIDNFETDLSNSEINMQFILESLDSADEKVGCGSSDEILENIKKIYENFINEKNILQDIKNILIESFNKEYIDFLKNTEKEATYLKKYDMMIEKINDILED